MNPKQSDATVIERTLFSTLTSLGDTDMRVITQFFRSLTPMEQTFVRMIFEEGYEQGTVDSTTNRPWTVLLEQRASRN